MATSLAEQLKKLAAPQTSLLQRDKKRVSLLFDPKVAAEIDRDTFYDIAISGLRDLQNFNPDFAAFENSLFSAASKNIERSVESKNDNVKLTNTIQKFLMLLSPYVLLKPAHKTLEWLIYRYSIHEYNKREFMQLILPYHETNIFARCLQLFNLQQSPFWRWLIPLQKQGVHLPKQTLYNHCASDVGFLIFVAKIVRNAMHANGPKSNTLTTVFTFYCTATIGALEYCEKVGEQQISAVLPSLLKGLVSNTPDYTASSYMIAATLVRKTKLSEKCLTALVGAVCDKKQTNLRMEATLLLLLVYQSQKDHFSSFPPTALMNLVEENWFVANFREVVSSGSYVMPLLVPVLKGALGSVHVKTSYRVFLESLFAEVRLDDSALDILIRIILDTCPSLDKSSSDPKPDVAEWYGKFLKLLESQYPGAFDKVVRDVMSSETSQKHRKALRSIMFYMMSGGKDESSTTIFEKLHHPDPDFRRQAVDFLVENFEDLSTRDREMFEGAVSERLLDDSKSVVKAVLKLNKKCLLALLGGNNFEAVAVKLLVKCAEQPAWFQIAVSVVRIMDESPETEYWKFLPAVLPFFFPAKQEEVSLVVQLLDTKFARSFAFLKQARKAVGKFEALELTEFCRIIHNISVTSANSADVEKGVKILPRRLEIHNYLCAMLTAGSLRKNCEPSEGLKALEAISPLLGRAKPIKKKDQSLTTLNYIKSARKGILPLEGLFVHLRLIINRVNFPKMSNSCLDLSAPKPPVKFASHLLTVILQGCFSPQKEVVTYYSVLLKEFLSLTFPDSRHKVNFLANFIVLAGSSEIAQRDPLKIGPKMVLRIINVIKSLVSQPKCSMQWALGVEGNVLVPAALIGLVSPQEEIRAGCLDILGEIVDKGKKGGKIVDKSSGDDEKSAGNKNPWSSDKSAEGKWLSKNIGGTSGDEKSPGGKRVRKIVNKTSDDDEKSVNSKMRAKIGGKLSVGDKKKISGDEKSVKGKKVGKNVDKSTDKKKCKIGGKLSICDGKLIRKIIGDDEKSPEGKKLGKKGAKLSVGAKLTEAKRTRKSSGDEKSPDDDIYLSFLKEVLEHRQEIFLDSEQFPLILCTILSNRPQVLKTPVNALCKMASSIDLPISFTSQLLKVLTFVNSGEVFEMVSALGVHILQEEANRNAALHPYKSYALYNIILRFNSTIAPSLRLQSTGWKLISLGLNHDVISLNYERNKFTCPSSLILEQVDRELFGRLDAGAKKALVDVLVVLATTSENPDVVYAVHKVVRKIDLDCRLLVGPLTVMKEVKGNKVMETKKAKLRKSVIPTADILGMMEWKRGITVLEFVQDKKKLINVQVLLPSFFGILKKCLDFDEQASVEYPKQLLLSAILHCCNKLIAEGDLPPSAFDMEVVVHCIRASSNPQTHHHALLLLACVAKYIPDQVLHNIMAVFTFMGTSVLRHDDAYSFQIIYKIIETVIPILVKFDGFDESSSSGAGLKTANRNAAGAARTDVANSDDGLRLNSPNRGAARVRREKSKANVVASVLRVFVDTILDVPEHRRLPVFSKLLLTLGPEDHLWLFLLLVFEAHVVHGNEPKPMGAKHHHLDSANLVPKRLDIATSLTLEFPPDVIIKTSVKLIDYLKNLPADITNGLIDTDCLGTFDIKQRTPKHFRHYKYTIVTFLSGLLSSVKLVNTIAVLDDEALLSLEPLYKNILVSILTYIQGVVKTVDQKSSTPHAQYWKVMLHHCYDIMDGINALLTSEMFLLVIRGLMAHNIPTIRRKALELLNAKLQHQPSFFYTSKDIEELKDTDGLFALVPPLISIIKTVNRTDSETEYELTQQTALLSLKLLTKLLAAKFVDKFLPILDYMTDLVKSDKVHGNILASVMLCLAELCSKLRAHAIPALGRFMPLITRALKREQFVESPGLLLMCLITTVQKVVETLPLFLSPYLKKLLSELAVLSAKWTEVNDPKLSPLVKKLSAIRANIGGAIPARILLPTVGETYENLLSRRKYSAVGPLMEVLRENLSNLPGTELRGHLPDLISFFITALQFRADFSPDSDAGNSELTPKGISTLGSKEKDAGRCISARKSKSRRTCPKSELTSKNLDDFSSGQVSKPELTSEAINLVEDQVIKTILTLVLKLSETTFRPFYYRLFDWAVRSDSKSERVITFYRLSSKIAENLKGLFLLFAGHFIKDASSLLDSTNLIKSDDLYFSDDSKNVLIISSIFQTLLAVFAHDNQNFIDRDKFDTLMQPLVDQLENTLGGSDSLENRATNLLIPCIAQFAVATADDALWKQMNYQILLKTRHNLPAVRLVGLHCVCEVSRKLGEDFLPLLPETIPFLAELLEDEDENVEKECRKVVQDMEKILGEPLQKYF